MNFTNPVKPGFQTSELWISVLAMVLTYLSMHGIISSMDINPIINAVGQIYGGAVGLITIFAIARSYTQSRTSIKNTMIQQGQLTPPNTTTPAK